MSLKYMPTNIRTKEQFLEDSKKVLSKEKMNEWLNDSIDYINDIHNTLIHIASLNEDNDYHYMLHSAIKSIRHASDNIQEYLNSNKG